jgi:ABC-2 type transport system ATP-binding protein
MEEADYLCDRIGIIDHGKIIALDTPKALKSRLGGGDIVKIEVEGDQRQVELEISKLDWVRSLGGLSLQVDNADESLSNLTQFIRLKGGKIKNISVRKPTLEEVFIKLTGREIR